MQSRFNLRTLTSRRAHLILVIALLLTILSTPKPAMAQSETVAYSFLNAADGVYPSAGVVRDSAGNIYGTTTYGGANGLGTVFKLSANGKTTLHNFAGKDGAHPTNLIRDAAGNLYGITADGGDLSCQSGMGCGTVYRLDASGKLSVVHSFTESSTDGGNPTGLTIDPTGNIYGTTEYGGIANLGTVFRINTSGRETILHSFTGGSDGAIPLGGVVLDTVGNVYGTTSSGGTGNAGSVFKIDTTGKESVLYRFTGGNGSTDGKNPMAGLVMNSAGNLYGTTDIGGTANAGTIFEVDATGRETILHSFAGSADGSYPQATLSLDSRGNLYGGTALGGTHGLGTVFKYSTSGVESVLHSFSGAHGQYPAGPLALRSTATGVVIYGTTQQGGTYGWGAVYDIVP